jgi:hypothetical protein
MNRKELEALATSIKDENAADGGESVGVLGAALNNLSEGLLTLLKGKGAPMPQDEEPEGEEPEGEEPPVPAEGEEPEGEGADPGELPPEPDDEDDEPGEGAGYDDMRLARGDASLPDDGDEYLDATDFLLELGTLVKGLSAKIDRQDVEIKKLAKAVRSEHASTRSGLGAVLAPMAKGVVEMDRRFADMGESRIPRRQDQRAVIQRHLAAAEPDAADKQGLTKIQLAKGRAAGLLSEDELRYYKQHGEFPGDDASKAKTLEAVKALE